MQVKTRFLILMLISFSTYGIAQEKESIVTKIKKKLFSSEKEERANSLIIIPAIVFAQETGLEYGIAGTYNFYLDKNNKSSKTSKLDVIGTLTTKKQKKINLATDLWTKDNEYHIIGELTARDWPFSFYGIGNNTWEKDEDKVNQIFYKARLDVEKRLTQKIYAGINVAYEHYKLGDQEQGGVLNNPDVIGKNGGEFLALGVSALFDSRDVTTYSSKGLYARAKYSYSPNFFGKDNFVGSQTELDIRGYFPMHEKITVAAQGLYRGTYGKNIPFYVKKNLGGDMSMRGYYLGRYKDNDYLTAQAEIRYRFHPRFATVGFVGTGTTFSNEHKARFVPSYGIGGRFFFSLEHKASLRLDYAFGEKRPGESRQSGFYLSLSEAF